MQAKPRNGLQLGKHEVNIGGLRSVSNGSATGEVTWLQLKMLGWEEATSGEKLGPGSA